MVEGVKGSLAEFIGFIGGASGIAALVHLYRHRQAGKVAAAEERGAWAERERVMKTEIDAAHEKIRGLDARQDEQEKRMERIEAASQHAAEGIDKLRGETNQQFNRLFALISTNHNFAGGKRDE